MTINMTTVVIPTCINRNTSDMTFLNYVHSLYWLSYPIFVRHQCPRDLPLPSRVAEVGGKNIISFTGSAKLPPGCVAHVNVNVNVVCNEVLAMLAMLGIKKEFVDSGTYALLMNVTGLNSFVKKATLFWLTVKGAASNYQRLICTRPQLKTSLRLPQPLGCSVS